MCPQRVVQVQVGVLVLVQHRRCSTPANTNPFSSDISHAPFDALDLTYRYGATGCGAVDVVGGRVDELDGHGAVERSVAVDTGR